MSRRVLLPLLVGVVLLLPSPSWSHGTRASSSLTGTITVVPGGIRVTVTNTGTDAFNYFWIRMPPSVHHTGASIDHGGGCGPGPDTNTVKCGVSFAGFQPGQTYVVTILTDVPYPPNGGAELFTGPSTDGPLDPAGTATGPAPTTPPASAAPCKCILLTARIVPSSLELVNPGATKMTLEFDVHWTLNCSKGAETVEIAGLPAQPACHGRLLLFAPHRNGKTLADIKATGYSTEFTKPNGVHVLNVDVSCDGHCAKLVEGTAHFTLISSSLGHAKRARIHSLPITIHRSCRGRAKLADIKLAIAFDGLGLLDKEDSDLR